MRHIKLWLCNLHLENAINVAFMRNVKCVWNVWRNKNEIRILSLLTKPKHITGSQVQSVTFRVEKKADFIIIGALKKPSGRS